MSGRETCHRHNNTDQHSLVATNNRGSFSMTTTLSFQAKRMITHSFQGPTVCHRFFTDFPEVKGTELLHFLWEKEDDSVYSVAINTIKQYIM